MVKEFKSELYDLISRLEVVNILLDMKSKGITEKAKWTRAYINTLPNSSFAYVEPCYGKTTDNKNARHLPYKDANGKVDEPHLRNALARVNQIKPICDDTNRSAAIKSARSKLIAAAKRAGIGDY